MAQHGSMESLLGDGPPTGKATPLSVNNTANQLEITIKVLMQTTGATGSLDVLTRFNAQKEAATRLNYLRTITEAEKRQLEVQRDELTAQLESLRFSDTKENEVYGVFLGQYISLNNFSKIQINKENNFRNQEYLEQLKKDITEQQTKENKFIQRSNQSMAVLNAIKSTLIDLIQKLHDFDNKSNDCEVNENTPNNILLQVWKSETSFG